MLVASPPPDAKVILITAEPPDFCAGYDLFDAYATGAEPLIAHEANFRQLRISTLPVVAALHGRVIGGGIEMALAADVRLGAPDTLMSIPAAKLGLVYSATGLRLLVDELGESIVRAMVLGGRRLTAVDALAVGGLSEIVPLGDLRDHSLALASTIASWPASATANNRRVLDVISGRVEGDTAALRKAGFSEGGALATRIEQFVAEHGGARPIIPPRSLAKLSAAGFQMIHRLRPGARNSMRTP
jgi:enoyl-CoA hydratase/carnithine racemase